MAWPKRLSLNRVQRVIRSPGGRGDRSRNGSAPLGTHVDQPVTMLRPVDYDRGIATLLAEGAATPASGVGDRSADLGRARQHSWDRQGPVSAGRGAAGASTMVGADIAVERPVCAVGVASPSPAVVGCLDGVRCAGDLGVAVGPAHVLPATSGR